jgi:exodeoxyribonuclease-3
MSPCSSSPPTSTASAPPSAGVAWPGSKPPPDVLTLQEVRASDAELRAALAGSAFEGWHVAHSVSGAKGRAGVAVLSRTEPVAVRESVGMPGGEFDGAGRWVEADVVVGSVGGDGGVGLRPHR